MSKVKALGCLCQHSNKWWSIGGAHAFIFHFFPFVLFFFSFFPLPPLIYLADMESESEKRKVEVIFFLFFPPSCESKLSRVERRHPAGLEKHCLVSQAGTFFVTWLKMRPNTIPITLSPPWLPFLHCSLHPWRIACSLLKPFRLLGAHCSVVAR